MKTTNYQHLSEDGCTGLLGAYLVELLDVFLVYLRHNGPVQFGHGPCDKSKAVRVSSHSTPGVLHRRLSRVHVRGAWELGLGENRRVETHFKVPRESFPSVMGQWLKRA